MKNIHHYLHAGYTHYIRWKHYLPTLKMTVDKGFPTTSDALQGHLKSLYTQENVSNVDVIVLQKESA